MGSKAVSSRGDAGVQRAQVIRDLLAPHASAQQAAAEASGVDFALLRGTIGIVTNRMYDAFSIALNRSVVESLRRASVTHAYGPQWKGHDPRAGRAHYTASALLVAEAQHEKYHGA